LLLTKRISHIQQIRDDKERWDEMGWDGKERDGNKKGWARDENGMMPSINRMLERFRWFM